jgi:hypothetical protein
MRSIPILLSILLSTIILVFAFTSTTSNIYNVPVKVRYHELSKPLQKQIDCLAENIYYEAGHESQAGQDGTSSGALQGGDAGNGTAWGTGWNQAGGGGDGYWGGGAINNVHEGGGGWGLGGLILLMFQVEF